MSNRDLLTNPCWSKKDLGEALPDSIHAVSVALPTWEDVIDYEEKKTSCIQKLKSIYPRFGFNPLISQIAKLACDLNYFEECTAWPYPNLTTAKKAELFCKSKFKFCETKIENILGLYCLIVSSNSTSAAKAFWQHTGLGASSRLAAISLGLESEPAKIDGEEAKNSLKERLADLYTCNPNNITLYPSGMAAMETALSLVTHLRPNKPSLQVGFPYVDVLKLPKVIFQGGRLILKSNSENLKKEIDDLSPAAVIVELPSNPMLQCVDLPKIAKIAHDKGIPVIADDTIGSAWNIDALPYADLIFSSLTKSFAGRGDILSGSLVISPYSIWTDYFKKQLPGSISTELSDPDAIELEIASRDFCERMPRLNESCIKLKNHLESHPEVSRVLHPESCSNFSKLMKSGRGYGCLLSFELRGGVNNAKKFYNQLEVCKGPSLGTNFTLVCPYVLLAHYNELDWAEDCGVPRHLLRVSVGLEDPNDLWVRFRNALNL